ncbi:FMRFamide receptor-like [Mytilus trossulus]|uniref:FMRFamide receptor-like n=1 Tax=Mytilus trossulus TaxID=6551 RepID=UPI003006C82F
MEQNITNLTSDTVGICDTSESKTFQFYAWGIVANIISAYGIIGNILSVIVLRHRIMQNSTSYYLISLAIYDTIVLLSMSLFLAIPTIYLAKGDLEDYYYAYMYMHPFCYPVALFAQTGTIYTTMAFTIERYIAVCRPLEAANTCTLSRTKRVICLIFVSSLVYNLPRFLEYETVQYIDSSSNTTLPNIQLTQIGTNEIFRQVYFIYLNLFTMFLLPFTFLAVLNIQLIRAVKVARNARIKMSTSASKEANLTVMLIAVIIVFLVCQLPSIADNILWTIFEKGQLHCSIHYIRFTTMSNLMVVVNSAINFILYCLFGKRFRKVFIKIFCKWKKTEPQFKYIMYDSVVINTGSRRVLNPTKFYDTDSTFV